MSADDGEVWLVICLSTKMLFIGDEHGWSLSGTVVPTIAGGARAIYSFTSFRPGDGTGVACVCRCVGV